MERDKMFKTDKSILVETLAESEVIKVERVVARGQTSEVNSFCPQEVADFLILLKGDLDLEYKDVGEVVELRAGDAITTQPGEENRVERTSSEQETVWVKLSFAGKNRPGIFPAPDERRASSRVRNIFRETAVIESLIETESVRVERVISAGHTAGAPCEQGVHEWLIVLQGGTTIALGEEKHRLGPGDHIFIPANAKSQVLDTARFEETIWVAAYWKGEVGTERALQGKFPANTGY